MKKIRFPRGIHMIHVPFMVNSGGYDDLEKELKKMDYPKTVKSIEIHMGFRWNKKGWWYRFAEATFSK